MIVKRIADVPESLENDTGGSNSIQESFQFTEPTAFTAQDALRSRSV